MVTRSRYFGDQMEQPMDDLRTSLKDLSTCDVLDPNTLLIENNNPNVEPQTDEDYMSTSLEENRSNIPSKHEVKEDMVKTEKKRSVDISKEPMERNHYKNPTFNYLIINMIVRFFIMKGMYVIIIRPVSLDISSRYGHNSTNHSPPSSHFHAESCRSFHDGQTNSGVMPLPVSGDTQTTPTRIPVSPSKFHQVFLNFRGEQLRYNFVSHLSEALERNKINFFIDENELRGKDLKNLFVRIQESRIALAVFSTRYAESKWCMNELVKMKKLVDQGKLIVIPIFYKVEPEDVRKPKWDSEFGRNFLSLAEKSNPDEIREWKEALESICDKMGLSLSEKSSETDCIEEIVKALQRVIEEIELEDEENHFGKK